MRYQVVTLEYKAYGVIPVCIPVPILILLCGHSVDYQVTAVAFIQPSDNIEKRRLARTAVTKYGYKLALAEAKAHAAQCSLHQRAGRIFLLNIFNLQQFALPPFVFGLLYQ